MSSSISSALNSVQPGNSNQAQQAPANPAEQTQTIQQQLAEASLTGVYGPPYILDVSLAYAVGNTPLSGSPPANTTFGNTAPAQPAAAPATVAAPAPAITLPPVVTAAPATTGTNNLAVNLTV